MKPSTTGTGKRTSYNHLRTSIIFDIPGRSGGGEVSRDEYLRFEELSPRKNFDIVTSVDELYEGVFEPDESTEE